MRRYFYIALLLLNGMVAAHAAANPAPTGRWITADHNAVIQISPCGGDLCGQIVGIALAHPNDAMPLAWAGQPQCGMVILQTAPASTEGATPNASAWVGQVLDPRNGSVYQARMMVDNARHLQLHGYVGLPIFGQTQVWTPYNGQTLAGCRLTDATGRAITKNG